MKHLTPFKIFGQSRNPVGIFENLSPIGKMLLGLAWKEDNQHNKLLMNELISTWPGAINDTDSGGNTPLIIAVLSGKPNMTYFLIKSGADLTIRNNNGKNFIEELTDFKREIRDLFKQYDMQRLILSKEPTLYKSFVKKNIPIHPDIEKKFGFAKSAGDLNLI
jgi:hypothetical protein